jgi:hypothetical protein
MRRISESSFLIILAWRRLLWFSPPVSLIAYLVVRGNNNVIYCRFYDLTSETWTDWQPFPYGSTCPRSGGNFYRGHPADSRAVHEQRPVLARHSRFGDSCVVWLDAAGRHDTIQTSTNKLSLTKEKFNKMRVVVRVEIYPLAPKLPHFVHFLIDLSAFFGVYLCLRRNIKL